MKKTKMLKKNYEFRSVLSKGKYYSGRNLVAFIKNSNEKNCNYLGIAISVKTGKATKRNYLKRLIRENYKNFEDSIKIGNNIVFLWKKKASIKDASFDSVKSDMEKIFDKAGLFRGN